MKYSQIVCRLYLSADVDLKTIPALEKQGVIARPHGPINSAAMADVEIPSRRLPLSFAVCDDEMD